MQRVVALVSDIYSFLRAPTSGHFARTPHNAYRGPIPICQKVDHFGQADFGQIAHFSGIWTLCSGQKAQIRAAVEWDMPQSTLFLWLFFRFFDLIFFLTTDVTRYYLDCKTRAYFFWLLEDSADVCVIEPPVSNCRLLRLLADHNIFSKILENSPCELLNRA